MRLRFYPEPRRFRVARGDITIADYGQVMLDADEMVSFQTASGRQCDFAAKEWGFYPTSSPNSRMKNEGFKVALVRDVNNKIQINVVETGKIDSFNSYLSAHQSGPHVVCWLDELGGAELDAIETIFGQGERSDGS